MSQRLLSGIQPTGQMHLGNYVGAISNWVKLQDQFEAIFLVVDLHSLTTVYENPAQLKHDKRELAIDILAAGVDPSKCSLANQSEILEHAELHLILSMITPLPWLTRVPSYKGKILEIKEKDLDTYGFLGYPVLMAADILLYKANIVPVGKDQIPHLELAREISRRFNHFYGPVFPEPQEQLTQFPVLPGTDGRKMSKSYNNTISLSLAPDDMRQKFKRMVTDPARVRRDDPGNPEVCPVFDFHKVFSSTELQATVAEGCRSAGIGCLDCKNHCADSVLDHLSGYRERRKAIEADLSVVDQTLKEGAERARNVAHNTMKEVRSAIGLN